MNPDVFYLESKKKPEGLFPGPKMCDMKKNIFVLQNNVFKS